MAREPIALIAEAAAKGQRADRWLTAALALHADAPTRATVQRWMEEGRVTIAGKAIGASFRLRAGDQVMVVPGDAPRTTAEPDDDVAFDVIYVDDDLVVLDKPAGLVVHPARGHDRGTLVNGLLARGFFRAPSELADPLDDEGHLRPGIVHRLDAGTSGVMVVARTPLAREGLKAQFAKHSIEREYEAICVGAAEATKHATLHGRHPTDRMRFSTKVREGKTAITHVEVIERFGAVATHVRCRLETGRTHQIRVHLAESGTPILADPLYGKPPKDPELARIGETLGHQALTARVLGFNHPRSGVGLRFEVELPSDFERAIDALRDLTRRSEGAGSGASRTKARRNRR